MVGAGEDYVLKGCDMRVVLVAMLVGCASLWLIGSASAQPKVIAGKNLDEWLAEIPSRDRSKGENAIRTVLLFGPKQAERAVPVLIAELKKNRVVMIDTSIRVNAAQALGQLLSTPDADPKQVADAVLQLKYLLHDSQVIVKYRVAHALGQIGPPAKSAIPDLIILLRDPLNWELRQEAAFALGRVAQDKVGGPPLAVLQALHNTLRGDESATVHRPPDSSAQVRVTAVKALMRLGPPSAAANQQALEKDLDHVATHDPDETVQIWAHMAFKNITGKIEQPRLARIGKLLASPELAVRIQAAQALGAVGPDAKSQAPALIAALDDPDKTVVGWSIWSLGQIGPEAKEALPRLEKFAGNTEESEGLRQMASSAVDAIQGKAKASKEKAPPG